MRPPGGGAGLDLGCGEGLLAELIAPLPYRAYPGVDPSAVAIDGAQRRASSRDRFETGDAATFTPRDAPDVIVLNEMLY